MASDNFNRANETTILSPWSNLTGGAGEVISIKTNAANSNSGGDGAALYSSAATSADQYGQADWQTVGTDAGGPAVRCSSPYTFYCLDNSGSGTVIKFVGSHGAFTDLGSPGGTKANPGKIEVSGSTINTSYGGVTNPTPKTDTAITTGQPGVFIYNPTVGQGLDNWEGGDLTVTPVTPMQPFDAIPFMSNQRI